MQEIFILQERMKLFDDVIKFNKTTRIPTFSSIENWMYLDAGYKLDEVLYDYDLMANVVENFVQKYQFDAIQNIGIRNPLRFYKAMGNSIHKVDKNGESVEALDHEFLESNDLKSFTENPNAVIWSKVLPKCTKENFTMGDLKKVINEFMLVMKYAQNMTQKVIDEYAALMPGKGDAMIPIDYMFGGLRGIKGVSMDLRKRKGEFKEALEVLYSMQVQPILEPSFQDDYSGYIAPVSVAMLAHSILSVKQFEELYWPYLKKVIDLAVKYNKPVFIYVESAIMRFAEFFQDIPKGLVLIHIEQDDIFELRKKLPNVALSGGMPTTLLGQGTAERCVNYAKHLVNTLGEGFVLSQNKLISYKSDAKAENIIALNEFARNYR